MKNPEWGISPALQCFPYIQLIRNILRPRPIRHQPEYITLDALARLYRAFRMFSPKRMWMGKRVWYYQVTDHKGNFHGRHCETFADFVDLHTKVSKIYRIY